MKTYVNDMDMRREGYIEGEKRGRAEGEKVTQKKLVQKLMESQKITEIEARKMLGILLRYFMETFVKWKHLPYNNMRVFTLDCPCPA